MFTEQNKFFMSNEMSLDVHSIESKLQESLLKKYAPNIVKLISEYISIVESTNTTIITSNNFDIAECINAHFNSVIKQLSLDNSSEIYNVIDSFRHAFLSYATGGLRNLYLNQENEGWYPKVKITKVLEPNQIDILPSHFQVYRGCNISELNNVDYGQSWSLSEKIAFDFAFKIYADDFNKWFDSNKRAVLTTTLSKEDIFYYSNDRGEDEVIVDIKKLRKVTLHK